MKNGLLDCPRDGHEKIETLSIELAPNMIMCKCKKCGQEGPWGNSIKEAETLWNVSNSSIKRTIRLERDYGTSKK